MWPFLLDYSRDECKRTLRRLELEAYSSVVSCFRAQGNLSQDKKKLLKELQHMLSISEERHRAEVRRAVNDERLSTVADSTGSSLVTSEWLIEGRRLVPLLPRLVPQTAFTQTASQSAKDASDKNVTLMNPALTGNKELASQSSIPAANSVAAIATKPSRPSSPTSNVVVLPSGTSIHIKGMLNPDDEDEPLNRRQRRSISIDGRGAATASAETQTARVIYTTASSTPGSASPVKITISKSPQGRTIVSQPGGQPPKVILVTSQSNQQSGASTIFQRSMSVPVIRASTSTSTSNTGATRTSIIIPGSPGLAHGSMPGVVTVTTTSITTSTTSNAVTMPTSVVSGSPVFSPSINIGKPRPKMVPRQRFPHPQNKPGLVIPMGPGGSQPVVPSPQNLHNIQVKTVPKAPPIHIKQEGGMKIITQSMAGASKILPKPVQLSGSPGTPVVVVNAGSSSAGGNTTVTMVPKTVGSYTTASGSKVLNITTPGGRVIATTTKASNVVTVNPKTLQLTAVKSNTGGTTVSKPNVIVVQKTQARRPQMPTHITKGGTTVITSPAAFEKELANFIQKESGRQVSVSISPSGTVTSATAVGGRAPEHRVIITTSGSSDPNRQGTVQKLVSADPESRTSLLAELIQAAGMAPEGGADNSGVGGNEWFEYDVEDGGQSVTSESMPVSNVQTIMGMPGAKIGQRSLSIDESSGSQDQYYSLEQAVSLLNPDPVDSGPLIPQPGQRIITSIGDGGRATVEIPRRHATSLMPPQTVVRTDLDAPTTRVVGDSNLHQPGAPGSELDPQTGLFYSSGHQQIMVNTRDGSILTSQGPVNIARQLPPHVVSETTGRRVSSMGSVPVVVSQGIGRPTVVSQTVVTVPMTPPTHPPPPHPSTAPPPPPHMDLVRSSLAQAQINLESFDFDDDDDDDGMGHYDPLDTDDGEMVGDGFNDDQPSLVGGEDEDTGGNFDAHTALLEESEAGASDIVIPAVPHTAAADPGLTEMAPPSITVSLPQPTTTLKQQKVLSQPQPTVTVSRLAGRAAGFVPLEEVKDLRSSGINIIKHEQKEAMPAPPVSSVNNTSSAAVPVVNNISKPLTSSLPPPTSTTTINSSKVMGTPTPTVSAVSTTANISQPVTLSSLSSQSSGSQKSVDVTKAPGGSSNSGSSVTGGGGGGTPSTFVSVTSSSTSGLRTSSSSGVSGGVSGGVSNVGGKSLPVTSNPSSAPLEAAPTPAPAAGSGVRIPAGPLSVKVSHSASVSPPTLVVRGSSAVSVINDNNVVNSQQQQSHDSRSETEPKTEPVTVKVSSSSKTESVKSESVTNVQPVAHKTETVPVVPTPSPQQNNKTDALSGSQTSPEVLHTQKAETVPLLPPVHKVENSTSSPSVLPVLKSENVTVLPVQGSETVTVLPSGEVIAGPGALTAASHVMEFPASLTGEQDGGMLGDAGSSDGMSLLDSNSLRQSKRKRRPPSALDEAAGSTAGGSWMKTAQNILAKVSRYRGTNREKGELNASAWFTQPVDPADAPDYYTIIKTPMDFGTIRRKLEANQYGQFDDFHADMHLVRSNCLTYNQPQTRVYRDCNQVFNYYNQEIDKMVEKSVNKVHTASPPKKQIRIEKSPAKT